MRGCEEVRGCVGSVREGVGFRYHRHHHPPMAPARYKVVACFKHGHSVAETSSRRYRERERERKRRKRGRKERALFEVPFFWDEGTRDQAIHQIWNNAVRTRHGCSGIDALRPGRILGGDAGDRRRQRQILEQRESGGRRRQHG